MAVSVEPAVLAAPPREVVPTPSTRFLGFLAVVLLACSVILPLTVGRDQIKETDDLVHHGVVVKGRVMDKTVSKGKSTSYSMSYGFDGSSDTESNRQSVSSETFDSYEIGDPIDVTYVRDRPSVNRLGRVTDDDIRSITLLWYLGSAAAALGLALCIYGLRKGFLKEFEWLQSGPSRVAEVTNARRGVQSKNGTPWYVDYRYDSGGKTYEGTCTVVNPSESQIAVGARFTVVEKAAYPEVSKPLRDFFFARPRQ